MKISGGSFENKANDISLRSMIDAQLMSGARGNKIIGNKVDYTSTANPNNPTTPQSIFANLISSKLAISHASIFNNLNSKSSEQISVTRGGQTQAPVPNIKGHNYNKFSPSLQSHNREAISDTIRNEFEKFKQLKKNSAVNYNKTMALSNHLLALTSKGTSHMGNSNNNSTCSEKARDQGASPGNVRVVERKGVNGAYTTRNNHMPRKPIIDTRNVSICNSNSMRYM